MNIQITYSGKSIIRTLHDSFDRVNRLVQNSSNIDILPDNWYTDFSKATSEIQKRLERPLCVTVIGDFKRGKSTLVNAILGQEVVTMDVLPETVTITKIYSGEEDTTELHLCDGGIIELTTEDRVSTRLEEIIKNIREPISHLHITYASPKMNQSMIVDTPGLGDLHWRFDKMVQQWLNEADVILYVISAVSPLSNTERRFLYDSLQPLDVSKLHFVVNMMDQIDTPDRERILNRTKDSLMKDFPDASVTGISASQMLDHQIDPQNICEEDLFQAFTKLRNSLDLVYNVQNDLVRSERVTYAFQQLLHQQKNELSYFIQDLESSEISLEDKQRQLQEEYDQLSGGLDVQIDALKERFQRFKEETTDWMNEFTDRFFTEVLPQLEELKEDHSQRHFPFFVSNSFKEALSSCIYHHIEELSQEIHVSTTPDESQNTDSVDSELNEINQKVYNAFETGTWAGNAYLFASGVHMLSYGVTLQVLYNSMLLGNLGGLIASSAFLATTSSLGIMKDQAVNDPKRLKQILQASKSELLEGISQNIVIHYDDLFAKASQTVKENQEQFGQNLLERINVLQKVSQQETIDNAKTKSHLHTLSSKLEEMIHELNELRTKQIQSMDIKI